MLDFNLKEWSEDLFGSYRFHRTYPPPKPEKPLEIPSDPFEGIGENEIVSKVAKDPRAFHQLERMVSVLQEEQCMSEERAREHVYTWTLRELQKRLNKLPKDTKKKEERFMIEPGYRHNGLVTTLNNTSGYGISMMTENMVTGSGSRYFVAFHGCCDQEVGSLGCFWGYRDKRRNTPYLWFGGLKKFPRDHYKLVVDNSRGIVFGEDNFPRADELHADITSILNSDKVRNNLLARNLTLLYAPGTLKELWKVSQMIQEYNALIDPSTPLDVPEKFATRAMIAYLDRVLPRQFYPLSVKPGVMDDLNADIRTLQSMITLLQKKSYVVGNPLKEFERMLERLKEYIDTNEMIDLELEADLNVTKKLIKDGNDFLERIQVKKIDDASKIMTWFKTLQPANMKKNVFESISILMQIFNNMETRFKNDMDAVLALEKPRNKSKDSWVYRLWKLVTRHKEPGIFKNVRVLDTNMAKIEKTHKNAIDRLYLYLNNVVGSDDIDVLAFEEERKFLLQTIIQLERLTEEQTQLRTIYLTYREILDEIEAFEKSHISPWDSRQSLFTTESKDKQDKLGEYKKIVRDFNTLNVINLGVIDTRVTLSSVRELIAAIKEIDYKYLSFPPFGKIIKGGGILDTYSKLENVNTVIQKIAAVARQKNISSDAALVCGAYHNGKWTTQWKVIEEYEMAIIPPEPGVMYLVRDLKPLAKKTHPDYFGQSNQIEFVLIAWDEFLKLVNGAITTETYLEKLKGYQVNVTSNNILTAEYRPGKAYLNSVLKHLNTLNDKLKEVDHLLKTGSISFDKIISDILTKWQFIIMTGTPEFKIDITNKTQSIPLYIRNVLNNELKTVGIYQEQLEVPYTFTIQSGEVWTMFDKYATFVGQERRQKHLSVKDLQDLVWPRLNDKRKLIVSADLNGNLHSYSMYYLYYTVRHVISLTFDMIEGNQDRQTEEFQKYAQKLKELNDKFDNVNWPRNNLDNIQRNFLDECSVKFKSIYKRTDLTKWGEKLTEDMEVFNGLRRFTIKYIETKIQYIQLKNWWIGLAGQCGLTTEGEVNIGYIQLNNVPTVRHLQMTQTWFQSLEAFCKTVLAYNYDIVNLPYQITFEKKSILVSGKPHTIQNIVSGIVPEKETLQVKYRAGEGGPMFILFETTRDNYERWLAFKGDFNAPVIRVNARTLQIDWKNAQKNLIWVNLLGLRAITEDSKFSLSPTQPDVPVLAVNIWRYDDIKL